MPSRLFLPIRKKQWKCNFNSDLLKITLAKLESLKLLKKILI